MHHGRQAPQTPPEGEFKYVLFAGYRLGSAYPHTYRLYHKTVTSVDFAWPDWLPHVDVRKLAPAVAPMHTRWPMALGDRVVAGARVSAIFTNDKIVRDYLFKHGWVDVSAPWAEAQARRNATPAQLDEPSLTQTVTEIATRALKRGRKAVDAVT